MNKVFEHHRGRKRSTCYVENPDVALTSLHGNRSHLVQPTGGWQALPSSFKDFKRFLVTKPKMILPRPKPLAQSLSWLFQLLLLSQPSPESPTITYNQSVMGLVLVQGQCSMFHRCLFLILFNKHLYSISFVPGTILSAWWILTHVMLVSSISQNSKGKRPGFF